MNKPVTIGTRDSQLAMWQTRWVRERLEKAFPEHRFETISLKTTGDNILDIPLNKIGDKGLFTKELDAALLRGDIDLAVHSLKDLPTVLPAGLTIGAITERWDARDALISRSAPSLAQLPAGATVATGSLRRKAQLLHQRPDLNIVNLRGNLNTRFRKFDESAWDAMILAVAGVERMGWGERIREKISLEVMLPAVGQGSFAVVCRSEDRAVLNLLRTLHDASATAAALAERAFLRTLEGGCHAPIGALAEVQSGKLILHGCIASLDGRQLIRDAISSDYSEHTRPADLEKTGSALAKRLLDRDGREILDAITAGGKS